MSGEYSPEFKERVLRVARLGEYSKARIAKGFDISTTCLSKWIKDDQKQPQQDSITSSEQEVTRDFFEAQEIVTTLLRSLNYAHREIAELYSLNSALMHTPENLIQDFRKSSATQLDSQDNTNHADLIPIDSHNESQLFQQQRNTHTPRKENDVLFIHPKTDTLSINKTLQAVPKKTPQNNSTHRENHNNASQSSYRKVNNKKISTVATLEKDYVPTRPRELLIVDITQTKIRGGVVFVLFISDAFSRRILHARAMKNKPFDFPFDELHTAMENNGIDIAEIIGYDDQQLGNIQLAYTAAMQKNNIAPEFGIKCNTKINSIAKSILALYYTHLIYPYAQRTSARELNTHLDDWVINWNTRWKHSALEHKTVEQCENNYFNSHHSANSANSANRLSRKLYLVKLDTDLD